MTTGKLAKWQMLLSEFDIVYVTQKAIKAQALADHLAENPVDEEYEPFKTYFHDEELSFVGKDISEMYLGWRLFFDGVANHQSKGIREFLVSESGLHYPMATKLRFNCMNNMAEYEACILDLEMAIDRIMYRSCVKDFTRSSSDILPKYRRLADALATIASMIKHPDYDYIDPLDIELKEHPVHYSHVDVKLDGLPWYFDIKKYLEFENYLEDATSNQKKSIRRMTLNFFLSGEIRYRRTPDLGLLKCIDVVEAAKLIEQIHVGVCGTNINGLTLTKKILRAGYIWMTMENDCCKFVQKCKKCHVHGDLI
ncbi:uncharacterized protein [Solanum lycopersicum]|uniref:uncharacterized protein n=1 Tax=Solanum lycopersicum TaxID=4081 RepID=UPI003749D585